MGKLEVFIGSLMTLSVKSQQDFCGYAPLCGSPNVVFDWEPSDFGYPISEDVVGAAEIEFDDCCLLRDTEPLQDCQIVDPSGESVRYATSSEPICGQNGRDCEDGSCSQYEFIIRPVFTDSSEPDGCCDTCSCYGDPQCISFDGTERMWVLCDGREIPDRHDQRCRITKDQCSHETDHAGNQCVYISDNSEGKNWIVGKDGSPCVPNPASPPSTILMYEVPNEGFSLVVQQGERGIIDHVYLELASGQFSLSAEDCIDLGEDAWDHSTPSLPESFSYEDVIRSEDIIWNVVDPKSGIAINIRCHANSYEGDSKLYLKRINVESVSDPYARGNNVEGFCVTGRFEYGKATTQNTQRIATGGWCADALEESDTRDMYRVLCQNPAMTSSGIPTCIYHFCSKYFAPLYESVEDCERTMNDDVATGFCRGVVYSETDVHECVEQWADLGPIPTINQYYNDNTGCTTEYQVSLEKCQSGIVVQYKVPDGWEDAIAIPSDYCGDTTPDGGIAVSMCDYPELFENRIRIVQKEVNMACGPVNQCNGVKGFRGFFGLVVPTPYPTQYPTTEVPTSFPTNYPTSFPTYPNGVTPYPTPNQDHCSPPPLCDTQPENVDITNGEFHLGFPYCCPDYVPPVDCDNQNTQQNRTGSSSEPFCQPDEGDDYSSYLGRPCEDRYELTISVMFDYNEDEKCCQTCTCFGDPRCYSFSGHFEEFILCDGRSITEDPSERCVVRRDTCAEQRDHQGHQCMWSNPNHAVPNYADSYQQWKYENEFSVMQYGSPCRYDPSKSSAPVVLLYQVKQPDVYTVQVLQGERGYIQQVHLETSNGVFEIDAERCLNGNSWRTISGSADPYQFTQLKYGKEYVWRVLDIATGIEMKIRCTGSLVSGAFTNKFINVDAIIEPDFDRIDDANGFCATDRMPEKSLSTSEHSDSITDGDFCESWNVNATEIILRDVARIIVNRPGVTQTGTENAYAEFCDKFFSPFWTSSSQCVSAFMSNKNVQGMIEDFCKAVTNDRSACEENLQIWSAESGYNAAFSRAYENYILNFEDQCEVTLSELPLALAQNSQQCETGVELQWWNPRKEAWVTYTAFPDNKAPCKGYTVTVNYHDHPKLFKNRLRIVQTHNFQYCSQCTYASEVEAWFEFRQ